jgi:hypothetical protein
MHGVEIYDCHEYLRMRLHWNGAGLLCHELCHLVHQFALDNGLANAKVQQAYLTAKASGLYDKALRRDWAGQDCDYDMAYAMVDHKEFWSEMSVTFLCDTYHDLDKVTDKTCMDACSPPYTDILVAERVQQRQLLVTLPKNSGGIPKRQLLLTTTTTPKSTSSSWCSSSFLSNNNHKPAEPRLWERFVNRLWEWFHPNNNNNNNKKTVAAEQQQQLLLNNRNHRPSSYPPCNKFFPFTRGQLRHHDIETYRVIQELWCDIEQWDDPMDDRICRCATKGFFCGGFFVATPWLASSSSSYGKKSKFQSQRTCS